jgi:hypothetical protein
MLVHVTSSYELQEQVQNFLNSEETEFIVRVGGDPIELQQLIECFVGYHGMYCQDYDGTEIVLKCDAWDSFLQLPMMCKELNDERKTIKSRCHDLWSQPHRVGSAKSEQT